ncbi:MAG: hypothetical protein OEM24_05600 [Paracoccaceae bacterium]|nr:hypothetical protein [Paracoccaceae bacterium]
MVISLKSVVTRTAPTLLEDAAGCLALVVLLYLGLHLPAFV